jgi:transcriptional regulator with XRE-family HTH domain
MEDDSDAFVAAVAENIRKYAAKRKMSLNKVADFSGIARSSLYRFLGGQIDITLRRVHQIAAALGVEPSKLLERR